MWLLLSTYGDTSPIGTRCRNEDRLPYLPLLLARVTAVYPITVFFFHKLSIRQLKLMNILLLTFPDQNVSRGIGSSNIKNPTLLSISNPQASVYPLS